VGVSRGTILGPSSGGVFRKAAGGHGNLADSFDGSDRPFSAAAFFFQLIPTSWRFGQGRACDCSTQNRKGIVFVEIRVVFLQGRVAGYFHRLEIRGPAFFLVNPATEKHHAIGGLSG